MEYRCGGGSRKVCKIVILKMIFEKTFALRMWRKITIGLRIFSLNLVHYEIFKIIYN